VSDQGPTSELQPGEAFAGHRIDAVAGRGGMGVVYRATQLDLDRTVALKLIAPALAQDPLFRERFIRETRVAAGIDHPNVIPVFYAGEHEGRLYLAMRYVGGEDLRTLVRREGRLDPARAARILAQVASALDAAHASGIVHRDVKPANILLGDGEHAYLTDFGLTKRMISGAGVTRPGGWVGTLGYVAPEQIRGDRVDARADVYALGCVLCHALTGSPPHVRESDEATLWAHLHDPPPALGPEVPPALGAVLARALAKEPGDRYPSAGDLGRAMLAAVGLETPSTPERVVATGAAAPPGRVPPVDEETAASPTPPATRRGAGTGMTDPAVTDAADRAPRKAARRRPQTAFLVVVVISVALVIGLFALALLSADDPVGSGAGSTNPQLPPVASATTRFVGTTPAGHSPNDIVATREVVWVSSSQDPTLTRIRTAAPSRPTTVDVGLGVQALATGFDTLWVAKGRTHSLRRLDLATGRPRGAAFRLPPGLPVAVAAGQGGVWVALRGSGLLVRFDPRSGRVDRQLTLPRGIQDMAVGEGYVWVVDRRGRGVTRVDPVTGQLKKVPVGTAPKGIAVGDGFVWVCISSGAYVQQIDPVRARKTLQFRTGDTPTGIDIGGGSVWVSNRLGGSVTRISTDPASTAPPVTVDAHVANPFAVAARGADVWITAPGAGRVSHLTAGG
jgi:streptogramin lyase